MTFMRTPYTALRTPPTIKLDGDRRPTGRMVEATFLD
jgi:hypothetical protein